MIKVNDYIELRPIKIDDCNKLYFLMKEIYPAVYDYLWTDKGKYYLSQTYSTDNISAELNEVNSLYYFICAYSETIGILKINKNIHEQIIHLQRIYLHPKHQGKGIGRTLFHWLENTFKSSYQTLSLEVMKSETKAILFYEKMGMTFIKNASLNFKHIKPQFKHILIYQKQLK